MAIPGSCMRTGDTTGARRLEAQGHHHRARHPAPSDGPRDRRLLRRLLHRVLRLLLVRVLILTYSGEVVLTLARSMEYMDAGSLEKLAGYQVPEDVLARVTASMVRGLKFLKDELQTMHRGAFAPSISPSIRVRHSHRRQADQRPRQSSRSDQALRFRRLRSTRTISCKDQHRLSVLHGARTHQRRIAGRNVGLHRVFRCLVARSFDDRVLDRSLPISAGDVLQRPCPATGDRPRRTAGFGSRVFERGEGFRKEVLASGCAYASFVCSTACASSHHTLCCEWP